MDTPPGVLPPAPDLQPLGPISPSRFVGLQSCALREVLAASRTPALLPTAPAARLGSVVHRLLEYAGRGRFVGIGSAAIEARWEELVQASERSAARSWLDRHLLPLSTAIPDYEVRKLRALAGASALAETAALKPAPTEPGHHQFLGYELAVATPDGQAAGRIDAVIFGENGPIIRDYKSGAIHEVGDTGERGIKEAYSSQLKLYAAIYAAMAGTWPARLELVPVGAEPEPVEFTVGECTSLLASALRLRDRINGIVKSGTSSPAIMAQLATPTPTACGHCPYRPLCAPYGDALASGGNSGWPSDLRGELRGVQALGNGRLMALLHTADGTFRIRGLDPDPERHPALGQSTPGDRIAAFSLRPAGSTTSFSEGPFSVLYKIP